MSQHSTYEALRHFADSWALAVMVLAFLLLCAWPFFPHAREANRRAANSILQDEETIDG